MAAAVVTVIVDDILKSLGEGMKLGQQWGVEREFIEIRDLLSTVMRVLPEAENKYRYSLELQKWVGGLKSAASDLEDLLEELSTEEALWQRERKVRRLFRPIVRLAFGRRMRDQLKDVARPIQDLIRSDRISLVTNIPVEIGETHEAAGAVPLIGRDDKKRELMNLLLHMDRERNCELPVLTVQGDRGIGKTALVKEVCSESDVSQHFDYIIWVDASPPFDENRIARDIIASLTNGGGATEEEKVVEEVVKLLDRRKKYLFILDNLLVKKSEIWRRIRFWSFLEGGATGSKILVIIRRSMTRSSEESVFHLGGLTREGSCDLLLKTAFKGGVEEKIDPAKLLLAEDIAAECHGNPLFLRTVGGYLSLQHDASDWSSLRDMLRARLEYSVLSTVLDRGYPYGHLSPMVKRYNNLPPRIKQCFGLCSLFPRGHAIDRQSLAELWIALGYINEDYRQLEVISDHYFDQLLIEELFQIKKFDTFGKVRSVVLHPDAENLAHSVAGWECLTERNDEFLELGVEHPRHISLTDNSNIIFFHDLMRRIRTILHFIDDPRKCEAMWKDIFPGLKSARVLDLHHMNVEAVHEGVWKLKLLRYLDLSDNRRIKIFLR